MERIAGEPVVEAFREIGMKPARKVFMTPDKTACCALTALAIKARGMAHIAGDYDFVGVRVVSCLPLPVDYRVGFMYGWNGPRWMEGLTYGDSCSDPERFLEGSTEGRNAWAAVVEAGLAEEDD